MERGQYPEADRNRSQIQNNSETWPSRIHESSRTNFLNPFNVICPVQPPPPKINRLKRRANQNYNSRRLIPSRGDVGHRHERWDGMRWTRRRRVRSGIAGRIVEICERSTTAQDERCCFRLCWKFRRACPAEAFGEGGSRTAKACGSGTRCWCQVGGVFSNPT